MCCQNTFAGLLSRLGEYRTAQVYIEEGLTLFRRLSDQAAIALALLALGNIVLSLGEYAKARAYAEECLALFNELDEPWGRPRALKLFHHIAAVQGDGAQAAIYSKQILTLFCIRQIDSAPCRKLCYAL